jgi:hypothetical protein
VGVQFTTFLPAVQRVVLVRQQQPDHPPPRMSAGVYVNRAFVKGRTVSIRADL